MRHLGIILAAALIVGCHRDESPLPQRAYVWQRDWTPAVKAAVVRGSGKLDGLVLLGSEMVWQQGQATPVRAVIDWSAVSAAPTSYAIALRVAPYPGPFDEATLQPIIAEAQRLLLRMKVEQVACTELQLDFDCAQKKLAGYASWLRTLRAAIAPMKLVITTLPVWLDEPQFATLIAEVDGYVLQVHSVRPAKLGDPVMICDPQRARRSVAQAARLGRPFSVALPTYSALAGFDTQGRLLGYAFDGPSPSWPADTKRMAFDTDAESMAGLVAEWQKSRPAAMQGVLWYRLPVDTDARNWRWATFAAVVEGRAPRHELTVLMEGSNPVDLVIRNAGEANEKLLQPVQVRWEQGRVVAGEALPGWTLQLGETSARFISSSDSAPALAPGAQRGMGWLRFDQPANLHVEILR